MPVEGVLVLVDRGRKCARRVARDFDTLLTGLLDGWLGFMSR